MIEAEKFFDRGEIKLAVLAEKWIDLGRTVRLAGGVIRPSHKPVRWRYHPCGPNSRSQLDAGVWDQTASLK
jgi:hypothetical protein